MFDDLAFRYLNSKPIFCSNFYAYSFQIYIFSGRSRFKMPPAIDSPNPQQPQDDEKARALANYKRRLVDYRDVESRLKELRKKVNFSFYL